MRVTRRRRLSEVVLRLVVRDAESYQGLLGDLHEEAGRAAKGSRGRWDYDRAVLSLAWSYVADRMHRRPAAHRAIGRGDGLLLTLAEDFRHASRILRRRRTYTAAVVGTLGLGFGAAAAVLSVAYGVWLRPLPFGDPSALVRIYEVKLDGDDGSVAGDTAIRPAALDADVARRSRLSPPLLEDLRGAEWDTLTTIAAVAGRSLDWENEGAAERLTGITASRGIFDVLQLRPRAGRFFSADSGVREVVLSEAFWRRAFGQDAAVVGRQSLVLDGEPHLIVGVAPDGLPYPQQTAEVWVPFDVDEDSLIEGMRGARYLDVVARMSPTASLAAASAELDAFVRGLARDHPNHDGWGATAVPLREDLVRPFVGILHLLLAGATLFLLIACSNVAGLVAARRVQDGGERRLRLALGASRQRVVRHEIAEMLILSAGGAALAAILAAWALAPLRRLAPADIPRIADIRLDGTVMALLAGGVLVAGVVVAVLGGALAARERSLVRGGGRQATAPNARGRATLMVAQVGLTTLLLIVGAALANHFRDLARIEPGFVAEGVVTAPVVLGARRYPDDATRLQFFEAVIDALERRGHVAAVGTNPPVAGTTMRFGYRPGDGDEEQYWGQYHTVSPRYFEVLGVALVAGRAFNDRDREDSAPVVIISEALARKHFEGDPVGREITVVSTPREIVGVVRSVHHFGPDQAPPAEMYVPLPQNPWLLGHVLVRPGETFAPDDLREVVAMIDAQVPVQELFPFEQFMQTWFAPLRFQLTVVGLLAAAGTALAVVGLYALIAYVVAGRTREIGIRVALGETSRSVFTRVVLRGLALAVAGIAIGTLAALALRGVLRSLGTGVEVADPTVLLSVAALIVVAGVAAGAWPARRAAAVDPVVALRQE